MTRTLVLASALGMGALSGATGIGDAERLASAGQVVQQQAHQAHHPVTDQRMQEQEARMMQMHQTMMAEMKAMDDTLSALVTKMNATAGDEKVAAIAELATEIVRQRTGMRDGMMQMHGQMMGHMMQHRAVGASNEAQAMIAACPMMKMMSPGSAGRPMTAR